MKRERNCGAHTSLYSIVSFSTVFESMCGVWLVHPRTSSLLSMKLAREFALLVVVLNSSIVGNTPGVRSREQHAEVGDYTLEMVRGNGPIEVYKSNVK